MLVNKYFISLTEVSPLFVVSTENYQLDEPDMNDREEWRERARDIGTDGMTG